MTHINPGTDTTVNPVIINDTHRQRQHSSEHQQPKEHIEYSSAPWKIYRQDAGMGEHDYAVFLNDVFFCRTEHGQTAHEIIKAISRPHPAPADHRKYCDYPGLCNEAAEASRKAREEAYEKFLKEIRKEVPVALGYIDIDSIEAVYIRLTKQQAGRK